MRILVQWSTDEPGDWVDASATGWVSLPLKPEPTGRDVLDGNPGWITAINVQGVVFNGYDHYAALPDGDNAIVYAWSDDPEDWAGKEYGAVWTFRPLRKDPNIGLRWNTRQTSVVFVQGDRLEWHKERKGFNQTWREWSEWQSPPAGSIRHGIWLPDDLYKAHEAAASAHPWTEWTEGVPARAIRNGRVHV